MRARPNWDLTNANAAIDEYLAAIADVDQPTNKGRTWIEFLLLRHGVIRDIGALGFGESHAIWYACLVITKRVRAVSRKEVATRHARADRTTAMTVRRALDPRHRLYNTLTAQILRRILEAQSAGRAPEAQHPKEEVRE